MEHKLPYVLIMNVASDETRRIPGIVQYPANPIANITSNAGYQNIQSTLTANHSLCIERLD